MPHEFRNLHSLPHEMLTLLLIAGGVSAAVLIGGIVYLRWRGPRNGKRSSDRAEQRPRKARGKKRRAAR